MVNHNDSLPSRLINRKRASGTTLASSASTTIAVSTSPPTSLSTSLPACPLPAQVPARRPSCIHSRATLKEPWEAPIPYELQGCFCSILQQATSSTVQISSRCLSCLLSSPAQAPSQYCRLSTLVHPSQQAWLSHAHHETREQSKIPRFVADPSRMTPNKAGFRCVSSCCLSCRQGTHPSFDRDWRHVSPQLPTILVML